MALVALSRLKDTLGVAQDDTASDPQLRSLLSAAEACVTRYCGRDFASQAYTEYYTGNNTARLVLRQTPVTAVAGVWLDSNGFYGDRPGGFDAALSALALGTDYVLDWDRNKARSQSGVLYRIGTVWPVVQRAVTLNNLTPYQGPAFGNVKVTYTAGFSPVPDDLQVAVCQVASFLRNNVKFGGSVEHEKFGDYAYTLFAVNKNSVPLLGEVGLTLAGYKEVGW